MFYDLVFFIVMVSLMPTTTNGLKCYQGWKGSTPWGKESAEAPTELDCADAGKCFVANCTQFFGKASAIFMECGTCAKLYKEVTKRDDLKGFETEECVCADECETDGCNDEQRIRAKMMEKNPETADSTMSVPTTAATDSGSEKCDHGPVGIAKFLHAIFILFVTTVIM